MDPEVAELQKAANNGYVKADYLLLIDLFFFLLWVLIVSQTMIHVSFLQQSCYYVTDTLNLSLKAKQNIMWLLPL